VQNVSGNATTKTLTIYHLQITTKESEAKRTNN